MSYPAGSWDLSGRLRELWRKKLWAIYGDGTPPPQSLNDWAIEYWSGMYGKEEKILQPPEGLNRLMCFPIDATWDSPEWVTYNGETRERLARGGI